ncbi:MAG: hypothetical protein DLM73_05860 [Chthoniobacterales bacterium]|nr:MAG: hypothetical protein DLM73_05860 [Chthoniobacterales bacterium]
MIFISIYPFASKKLLLLVVAFLCLSSAFCFADSLFLMRHYASGPHRVRIHPGSTAADLDQSNRLASTFLCSDCVDFGKHDDGILSAQTPPTLASTTPAAKSAAVFLPTEIGPSAPGFRLEEMANPEFGMLLSDPWTGRRMVSKFIYLASK